MHVAIFVYYSKCSIHQIKDFFISESIALEARRLRRRAAVASSVARRTANHQTNYGIQNNRVRLTFMRVTMRDFPSFHNIHRSNRPAASLLLRYLEFLTEERE